MPQPLEPGHVGGLADLLPPEWLQNDDSSVWMTAYRMVDLAKDRLTSTYIMDLNGLRVVFLYGRIPNYDASSSRIQLGGERHLSFIPGGEARQSQEGPWLLFFGEYRVSGTTTNEAAFKAQVASTKGLLVAIIGRNVAYDLLCDNIVKPRKREFTGFSPVFKNPYVFPSPRMEEGRLKLVRAANDRITASPEAIRNRYNLSLHWYEAAIDDDGVDAYLKTWIALEVLAMPDSTDIAPVKQLMAQAYGMTPEAASASFFLGWLCSIRGSIVHKGTVRSLHYAVPMYLEAVYQDCFLAELGLHCEGFADAVRHRPDLDLQSLLRSII